MRQHRGIALRTAALGAMWLGRAALPPRALPHAIAAPRRILAASAGRVSYYEDDSASGSPVVLLHDVGPTGSAYEVRGLFEALREDRPVIAADLPGYGFSERREAPLDRDGYVRCVAELLADVGARHGRPVDVVAVGRTCELAARAARDGRSLVRSLVLVSPTGFAPHAGAFADAVDHGRRALGRVLATRAFGPIVHRALTSRPVLEALLARRSRVALDTRFVAYARDAARQPRASVAPIAAACGALSDRFVVADVYEQLVVPVCFLHGDGDHRAVADVVGRHAGFRRAHIPGVGDLPHLEAAARTAEAIKGFWRGVFRRPELRLLAGGLATAPTPFRGAKRCT